MHNEHCLRDACIGSIHRKIAVRAPCVHVSKLVLYISVCLLRLEVDKVPEVHKILVFINLFIWNFLVNVI